MSANLHDVNPTVRDTSVPDFKIQVGVLSQPATVTDRTFPCIEPQSLKRRALELIKRLAKNTKTAGDAMAIMSV